MRNFIFLLGLITLVSCQSQWKSGIYQGILRSADGPGREVNLYLMPDMKFIQKTVFLKLPKEVQFDYGNWRKDDGELLLIYQSGSSNVFKMDKNCQRLP